jgi:hypothetical protein
MSRNELDERMIQAKFENAVGERVDFGSRPRCPKCHRPHASTEWCRGKDSLIPAKGIQCPLEGEHIHRICPCTFHWIERPADDEANEKPTDSYDGVEPPDVLAALVKMAGGTLTIPADVLAQVQADAPGIEVQEFSYGVRLKFQEQQADWSPYSKEAEEYWTEKLSKNTNAQP